MFQIKQHRFEMEIADIAAMFDDSISPLRADWDAGKKHFDENSPPARPPKREVDHTSDEARGQ